VARNENFDSDFSKDDWSFLSEVDLLAAEKVQHFLAHERQEVDDRIKNFALEENRKFEELRQTVLEDQENFIKMVKIVRQKHDLIHESFDKENNLLAKSIVEKNQFSSNESNSEHIDFLLFYSFICLNCFLYSLF